MSKHHDYISGKQLERLANGKTFKSEAAIDGTTFGLTALEVAEAGTKWGAFDAEVTAGNALDAAKLAQTEKTKKADAVYEECERRLATKMKANDVYKLDAAQVGKRYAIIGEENAVDVANSAPALTLAKVPSGWEINFNLQSFFTGVRIYRKRPTDADFSYIATDLSSPYIDTDKQVDGTQYYAYFIIGDTEVGQQSAVATVQV